MTILLDAAAMNSLLDIETSIAELRLACEEQARRQVEMPPRQTIDAHNDLGWLRLSTAFLNGSGYMGFKAMNRAPGIGMRYMVGLYGIATGELLAVMDANDLTTHRTAATNALGTDLLAPEESRAVGLIGSGVQARAFVRAYGFLRNLESVYVYSPRSEARSDCAAWIRDELGVEAVAVDSVESLAMACPVTVVAMRASSQPVYRSEWLRPGVHVTGLSSVRPEAREVEEAVWERCDLVVVDDRSSVLISGDGQSAKAAGQVDPAALPELWELVTGRVQRHTADQMTMFKSSGNAMQDVAVAVGAFRRAKEADLGQDLGPFPAVKDYA